jgi:hypothetical protein
VADAAAFGFGTGRTGRARGCASASVAKTLAAKASIAPASSRLCIV